MDSVNMDVLKARSTFQYNENFTISEKVKAAFDETGYIILKNLLDVEEVNLLKTALESDKGVLTQYYKRDDGMGRTAKIVLWNQPGNDITGVIARTEKVAGTFEKLLQGEVYHYHSKVIMKEARTGGSHIWHQDYGYWYENGCLFPNMGTVWIAVDNATKENGCVQFLHGSHKAGRIDHIKVGEQATANSDRLQHLQKVCPLMFCELEPGDAMFFHCNLLHCSAQNNSDKRRWGFLVAYNRADNDPVIPHHHPGYSPLDKLPNSAIKKCTTTTDMTGKDFFQGPKDDVSLKGVDERGRREKNI